MSTFNTREPLLDYPWRQEASTIIHWLKTQPVKFRPFIFDVCMSLAYIDSTSGLEKHLQSCPSCPPIFNAHAGFINLCSPCFENKSSWQYQKAAKPQSGALGKLSSEMILKFIEILFDEFIEVYSIGGTEVADAKLVHQNGNIVLAEVKSAPLLTYPVLVSTGEVSPRKHEDLILTSSQFRELESALYMHNREVMPLGRIKDNHWPFKSAALYLTEPRNEDSIYKMFTTWEAARTAYAQKDRNSHLYYLANASGGPPKIAKTRDNWPRNESISDSKTSAGMDRTDDIKKGVYQVLKLGISNMDQQKISTGLISNLPAYRHGEEYIDPFIPILWGTENDIMKTDQIEYLNRENLSYIFDHIITLDTVIMR